MTRFNGTAGIFIGGQGRRLGGIPKGMLPSPENAETLVENTVRKLHAAGVDSVVLVGTHPAYDALPLAQLSDAEVGLGPMSGLVSLVNYTLEAGRRFALAIACDMPFLGVPLLRRICEADENAIALVPRREKREPLCARYDAHAVAPHLARCLVERRLSLMALLDSLGAGCVELSVDNRSAQELADWDEPDDLKCSHEMAADEPPEENPRSTARRQPT